MAAYVLTCVVCRSPFCAGRSHAKTCSGACREKLRRRQRTASTDARDAAWWLVKTDAIKPWQALDLLTTSSVRDALAHAAEAA